MPATNTDHKKARELILQSMSRETNEEMDAIVDESYVAALPFPTQEPGREGLKKIFADARDAYPDAVWTEVFHMIDGNRQVLRYRATGTHQKDWLGIPAKNNRIELPAIFVIDLNDNGKIVSTEMFMDGLALTKQMQA